ncbi:hypothetical protein JTE90_024735 [Oedothorax gibbosus]|uniref:Uncharacterized protein n=1 Tax=Oedothorax gibbosus TaxID=931172 RepID=A0AAV6U8Y0_9ARAC|nr:hypothetical protein JTE90_024735 [Oedothorax gibbosus]
MWVISLQPTTTYGNTTNNRLQSLNSKVVQVVEKFSTLPVLFKNLDNLLCRLRMDRDKNSMKVQLKVLLNLVVPKDEKMYLDLLTPYAFSLVATVILSEPYLSTNEDIDTLPVFNDVINSPPVINEDVISSLVINASRRNE